LNVAGVFYISKLIKKFFVYTLVQLCVTDEDEEVEEDLMECPICLEMKPEYSFFAWHSCTPGIPGIEACEDCLSQCVRCPFCNTNDHIVGNSLNGNNGSATNTDDHDNDWKTVVSRKGSKKNDGKSGLKGVDYQNKVRMLKEASNKKDYAQGGNTKVGVDHGPKLLTQQELAENINRRRINGKAVVVKTFNDVVALIEVLTTNSKGERTNEYDVNNRYSEFAIPDVIVDPEEVAANLEFDLSVKELAISDMLDKAKINRTKTLLKKWDSMVLGVQVEGSDKSDMLGVFCVKSKYNTNETSCPYGIAHIEDHPIFGLVARCDTTSTLYPVVKEDSIIDCVTQSHAGYFVKYNSHLTNDFKGCNLAARGILNMHEHGDCKLGGFYFKKAQCLYYTDVYSHLKKTFPAATGTEHNLNGMLASIQRKFLGYDCTLIINTVNVVHFERQFLSAQAKGSEDVFNNIESLSSDPEVDAMKSLTSLSSYESSRSISIPSIQCVLPKDWVMRDDLSKFTIEGRDMIGQDGEFAFTTMDDPDHLFKDKYSQRRYFRVGGVKDFVVYGNTPQNMLKALKRLIGTRTDENECHESQLKLLGWVWWRLQSPYYRTKTIHSTFKKMLKSMNLCVALVRTRDVWMITIQTESLLIEMEGVQEWTSPCAKDNFLVAQALKFMESGNRDTIDKMFDSVNNITHWAYHSVWEQYLTTMSPWFSRSACAAIPHIKRELRSRYVQHVKVHDEEDILVVRPNGKVKQEKAKGGNKVPRIYVDYGAACMYANELPEFMKVCISGEHIITVPMTNGFKLINRINIVSKPRKDSIGNAFDELINVQERHNELYTVIYSDDMCMAGNIMGQPFCYNVDISSCDMGNRQLTFCMVGGLLGNFSQERVCGSIEQCMKPIELFNPFNVDEKIIVQSEGPAEGSGHPWTTVLNHSASFNNACSATFDLAKLFVLDVKSPLSANEVIKTIVSNSSKYTGHITTVQDCFVDGMLVPELIQFLKHSPIKTVEGDFVPVINLACILRSFGIVDGSITPEKIGVTPEMFKLMSESERMDRFFSSVVSGLVHVPHCNMLKALRERFGVNSTTIVRAPGVLNYLLDSKAELKREFGEWTGEYVDYSVRVLDENSLATRYGLTSEELQSIGDMISKIQLGSHFYNTAVDKLFEADYGL